MHDRRHAHDAVFLLVLLFPLVGIGIAVAAVRATIRAVRYGASILELQTLPASPGGTLAGTIHLSRPMQPRGPVRLRLFCERTQRTGKNSTQITVWEDEKTLDRLRPGNSCADIPVYFAIPPGLPATTSRVPQISWTLQADAACEGAAYRSRFVLPVFSIADPIVLSPPPEFVHALHQQPPTLDELHGISVARLADGGCMIHFAAARNVGSAIGVSAIGAVFTLGGPLALHLFGYPALIVAVPFLLVGVAFDIAALYAWLGSTTITARRGLQIDAGLPLLHRQREFQSSDLSDLTTKWCGSAGNTQFFAISATTASGSQNLVRNISGKANADYLADQIRRALGMPLAPVDAPQGIGSLVTPKITAEQ